MNKPSVQHERNDDSVYSKIKEESQNPLIFQWVALVLREQVAPQRASVRLIAIQRFEIDNDRAQPVILFDIGSQVVWRCSSKPHARRNEREKCSCGTECGGAAFKRNASFFLRGGAPKHQHGQTICGEHEKRRL